MGQTVYVGDLQEEKIKGIIKKIIFRGDNDYIIGKMESDNIPNYALSKNKNNFQQEENTFIFNGTFMNIFEKQNLKLIGKWTKHPKFGYQFKVSGYEQIMPTSKIGIEKYLASGLFKGIGPATARKIVDRFGENTLKIMDKEPEKLGEIKGISSNKICNIVKSYSETEKIRGLMLKLKPYNISDKKIIKIYKTYGDKSMEIIISNPYRLCDDIEGIGFEIADRIARACNIGPNDDFRIRAGILYCLNKAMNEGGHDYLPYDIFLEECRLLLQNGNISGRIDKNNIVRVAIQMNNLKELVMEKDNSVYLPSMYNHECYISKKVIKLSKVPVTLFKKNIEESIKNMEKEFNLTYAEQQKESFRCFSNSNILVITGGPGTGKTTIINGLIHLFKENFKGSKIALAAPTGRAAKKMYQTTKLEAKTIHRLLEYQPMNKPQFTKNAKNLIEADVIIIDEASMIDISLMDALLKAISINTKLVIVGDIDQLPSVGPGLVLKDIIESNAIPIVRLDKIFRQEDTSRIVINAYKINKGDLHIEFGDDFVYINEENPNNIPKIINKFFLEELGKIKDINGVQVLSPVRKKTCTGVNNLNLTLQELINPAKSNKPEMMVLNKIFRKYDKVMQYKNNYDKDVYNGDIGIIENLVSDIASVKIEDSLVDYTRDDIKELQLAYASTIHKAQGSEYPVVIIPISLEYGRMLQRNLIYTGITRAKKKVIIIGSRRALAKAILNNKISKRYSKLKERILEIIQKEKK